MIASLSPTTHPAIPGPAWDDADDLGRENETLTIENVLLRDDVARLWDLLGVMGLDDYQIQSSLVARGRRTS